MGRLPTFARRHGFDLLIVIGAIESALEAALHQDAALGPGTSAWIVVPMVPFVVLPLLARRRFAFAAPLAVWVVAAGLSFIDGNVVTSLGVLFAAGMAAAFLLGNVQNATQGRIGLAVTLAAASIIAYNDPDHGPGEFLVTPGLFAIAWLAGLVVRERSAQAASSEERALEAERKREENARQAVFAERVRIAREVHDVVAHHVSMMGVQAGAARVVIDRDPSKAKTALSAIETSSRQAVSELHRLLGFLRQDGDEDGLVPQPGVGQLGRLVASMSDTQLGVDITVEGDVRPLPQMVDVSAYRIVQEALTNTLKHARASHAEVNLRYWPDELEVEVVDDGRGVRNGHAHRDGGLGLIGMRERAALHGGQLSAGAAPGGGFAVRVRLPTADGPL
ncbi:MAG: sensor histidine kinase [Solirubrobacteraceae bacterium]